MRDLFGSMPVRVKHRALQAEKASFVRDWDRLLLDVVALLIAWPGTVSMVMRETSVRHAVTLKANTHSRQRVENGCQLLHQASLRDTPTSSEWVAIGASAPTLSVSGYVCRVPVATKRIQFLSLGIEPLSNELHSNILYEEINKVFADSSFGLIEDECDTTAPTKTSMAEGFFSKDLKAKKGVDRWPMFFLQITPTSTSQVYLKVEDVLDDRQTNLSLIIDLLKAMFYEFLKKNHCQPKAVALSTKSTTRFPRSRVRSITPTSGASTASSASSQQHKADVVQATSATSADVQDRGVLRRDTLDSRPASPFAAWSKVKSGQIVQNFKDPGVSCSQTPSLRASSTDDNDRVMQSPKITEKLKPTTAENSRRPLFDANGKLTRKPFEDVDIYSQTKSQDRSSKEPENQERTRQPMDEAAQDAFMECINPCTQMTVSVNSRTGFSTTTKPLTLSRRAAGNRVPRLGSESGENDTPPSNAQPWVEELVNKWKNPVFELTEEPIPKLPDVTEILAQDIKSAGHHGHCGQSHVSMGTRFETSSLALTGRVSKQTLSKAELIAQVDRKFICAKIPFIHVKADSKEHTDALAPSSGLLLIDQHAADERCRVEELMAGYFKPMADSTGELCWQVDADVLPKPVHFELSRQEESILRRFQQYFSYWGIFYDVEPTSCSETKRRDPVKHHGKFRLAVTRLPPAIVERCRTEPRLLSELIRKEAWRLNDDGGCLQQPKARPVMTGKVEGVVPVWVSLLHGCPPGILDLINSRSCRSEPPAPFTLSNILPYIIVSIY